MSDNNLDSRKVPTFLQRKDVFRIANWLESHKGLPATDGMTKEKLLKLCQDELELPQINLNHLKGIIRDSGIEMAEYPNPRNKKRNKYKSVLGKTHRFSTSEMAKLALNQKALADSLGITLPELINVPMLRAIVAGRPLSEIEDLRKNDTEIISQDHFS
jgi:hypothetical protein